MYWLQFVYNKDQLGAVDFAEWQLFSLCYNV